MKIKLTDEQIKDFLKKHDQDILAEYYHLQNGIWDEVLTSGVAFFKGITITQEIFNEYGRSLKQGAQKNKKDNDHSVTYRLVYDSAPHRLSEEVNERLKDGWTLHGSLICDTNGRLMQAMIKSS